MFAVLSRPNRLLGLALLVLPALGTAFPANAQDKLLTDFSSEEQVQRAWVTVNDTVMGGVSEGQYTFTGDNTLLFRGNLSLDNNGGFASVRTRTADLDLAGYDAVAIRVKGDGRTYNFDLRTASPRMASSYRQSFETRDGEWLDIRFPLEDFVLTSFGRRVDAPPPRARDIASFGFTLSDKDEGPFRLEIGGVKATNLNPSAETSHTSGSAAPPAGDLVNVATRAGQFNTLLAAATAAGLVEALKNSDANLTIFAPTDDAFAALPEGTVESLLQPENQDQLVAILSYHVLPSAVFLEQQVETLQGQTLNIQPTGEVKINGATVLAADVRASNGVIHVIDRVLLPSATPNTPTQQAMTLIELAIQRGVPQFNHGNPAACAAIYEVAATSLLSLHRDNLSDGDIQQLDQALDEIQSGLSASDQAWALRGALDHVYASLSEMP
ncbi:MAG: CIA30 family protein [Planctomycetota bacterium]